MLVIHKEEQTRVLISAKAATSVAVAIVTLSIL